MSTGYQISEQDELHFVTFQIVKWIDLFTRKVYREIVIDSLRFCQQNKGLEIYAFIIMSSREWMLNLFEFTAKQHKRNERYCGTDQFNTEYKMNQSLFGFIDCKSGDLLLTRRSERRYAERGGDLQDEVLFMSGTKFKVTGFDEVISNNGVKYFEITFTEIP